MKTGEKHGRRGVGAGRFFLARFWLAAGVLLACFSAAQAGGPFSTGDIAIGGQGTYKLTWTNNDSNAQHKYCAGYTYNFTLDATPSTGWKIVSKEAKTPLTLTAHDAAVVAGTVVFQKLDDSEQKVEYPVPFQPTCIKMVDNGHASIPFTSVITKDEIKTSLNNAIGKRLQIDSAALSAKIRTFLQQQFGTQDETWFNSRINEGIAQISAAVEAKATQFNTEVTNKVDAAATAAKAAIDGASPAAVIDATYGYHCGQRDIGDPGWGGITSKVSGFTNLGVCASVDFVLPLEGEASVVIAGVKFETTVEFHASISFEVAAKADNASITPVNTPTATASSIPSLTLTPKFSVSQGVGLSVSFDASITVVHDFDRQSGAITATPPGTN